MGDLIRVSPEESIARVVADIRAGRARRPATHPGTELAALEVDKVLLARAQTPQPVVDATGIYRGLLHRAAGAGINLYSDFPSAMSPWPDALVCYVNTHGNVIVLQVHVEPWGDDVRWETPNDVQWGRVRWLVEASAWAGGRGDGGRDFQTTGPMHLLQNAVYDDGSPADMHWVALLKKFTEEVWQMPQAVLAATLNFMACSNIELAQAPLPVRVRQRMSNQQRRVQLQTIVVRPPGRRSSAAPGQPVGRLMDGLDTPLTSVRGSFGHYGPQYERGLLFGKYAGKFWRPAHARGAAGDEPPPTKDYVLRPGLGDTNIIG